MLKFWKQISIFFKFLIETKKNVLLKVIQSGYSFLCIHIEAGVRVGDHRVEQTITLFLEVGAYFEQNCSSIGSRMTDNDVIMESKVPATSQLRNIVLGF